MNCQCGMEWKEQYNDKCPRCERRESDRKRDQLYFTTNRLMIVIGACGSIDSDHEAVSDVMDALFAIDGGVPIKTRD